jgi:uncharacterized membrane protein
MFGMGCLTIYIIFALIFLLPLLFAQMVTGAFVVLGFTPQQALLILISVLFGGLINIPIKKWPEVYTTPPVFNFFFPRIARPQNKILAVNVGGAVIPGLISLWEIYRVIVDFPQKFPQALFVFLFVFGLNTMICYRLARPIEGKGIAIPAFIPPFVVSIPSVLLMPDMAPVIAFPAGVLGVLLGADILHLRDIRHLNAPVGSIGGAGTFDGIFLCGILSVFLTG